jgi:hypothetical protein
MLRKSFMLLVMGAVMFLFTGVTTAQVPGVMNYQGKLTTASGGCLNDTVQMTFTIYDDEFGTTAEWTETQYDVAVKEGVFSVLLGNAGSPIPASVFDGSVKYLGVQVESDPEMTPLKPMGSVAYAFNSATAAPDADWTISGDDVYRLDGNVGVGTETPAAKLHVTGGELQINTDQVGGYYSRINGNEISGGTAGGPPGSHNLHVKPGDNSSNLLLAEDGGNVGIGTDSPSEKLDVAGTAKVTGFTMPTGAASGYVLTSDPSGAGTWQAAAAGGDIDWTFRITDTADTTLMTGGEWGIARSGNLLYGNADSTHVNLGVACTTGMSGENLKYASVGGGLQNTAGHNYTTVGGGYGNTASGPRSNIGGGYFNIASGFGSTVGGGQYNIASGYSSTIAGGSNDSASHEYAAVGGGRWNVASGWISTIGGGQYNTATMDQATVGGGHTNTASGYRATVAGGYMNTASGTDATVGGGQSDTASGEQATVAGGMLNLASGNFATVGGGHTNTASYSRATVAGGYDNIASGLSASVGGGELNTASGRGATIAGGYQNTASIWRATVGGGDNNTASGSYATVPGGYADTAAGDYSLAAGDSVRITSDGDYTFAFGRDFTTSTPNAVIFHNSVVPIKVGIGTTAPDEELHVAGNIKMVDGNQAAGRVLTSDANGVGTWQDAAAGGGGGWADDGNAVRLETATDSVGIGTATPSEKLEVSGNIKASGTITSGSSITIDGAADKITATSGTIDFDNENLQTTGNAEVGGFEMATGAGTGKILTSDASGVGTWQVPATGGIGGSGTTNRIPKFTASTTLGNSAIYETGGRIGIGTTTPDEGSKLHVQHNNLSAGYFTSNYLSNSTEVIHSEFTGTGNYDAAAVYGKCAPADYYGDGGKFWGGHHGVVAVNYPTGSADYYGVYGVVVGGSGSNLALHGLAGGTGDNYGVNGLAYNGTNNYGVYGHSFGGTTNWAGYFDGDAKVTGTLTKGGGSFQIDHPLDPENKYLYHSFVESPDMMNVYNGNVVLDASGEAVVQLPDYFEALNRDFRYQLTAIGAPGPNLYIAEKIAGNQFTIAGGEPGAEVSWQVTGIRHDKFAEANRIQVEVDKPADELGKYIHPQAYGLGEEYDIHYEQNKRMEEKRQATGH